MNELKEALLKISVGRNGKDWVDEPVDAIMKEISPVIESLLKKQRKEIFETIQIGYYQCVVDTQRNADILKAELQDLVNEYKKIEPGGSE